jgi:hypothetical protein
MRRGIMRIVTNRQLREMQAAAEAEGYRAGSFAGGSQAKKRLAEDILAELMAKSLNDFTNEELKLGYNHAVDVVKTIIERNKG